MAFRLDLFARTNTPLSSGTYLPVFCVMFSSFFQTPFLSVAFQLRVFP